MGAIVGVGVPPGRLTGGWDLWLPIYMLLALLLIRFVAGLRIGVPTAIAAFVAGTLWAWTADVFGVAPAGGTAILLAVVAGKLARRHRPHAGPR
jgi:hypothetical protein